MLRDLDALLEASRRGTAPGWWRPDAALVRAALAVCLPLPDAGGWTTLAALASPVAGGLERHCPPNVWRAVGELLVVAVGELVGRTPPLELLPRLGLLRDHGLLVDALGPQLALIPSEAWTAERLRAVLAVADPALCAGLAWHGTWLRVTDPVAVEALLDDATGLPDTQAPWRLVLRLVHGRPGPGPPPPPEGPRWARWLHALLAGDAPPRHDALLAVLWDLYVEPSPEPLWQHWASAALGPPAVLDGRLHALGHLLGHLSDVDPGPWPALPEPLRRRVVEAFVEHRHPLHLATLVRCGGSPPPLEHWWTHAPDDLVAFVRLCSLVSYRRVLTRLTLPTPELRGLLRMVVTVPGAIRASSCTPRWPWPWDGWPRRPCTRPTSG